jgi:DNA repair exonuclease SbcCD ATPase subunit
MGEVKFGRGISRWRFFGSLAKGSLHRTWEGSHKIHTAVFLLANVALAGWAVHLEEYKFLPVIILVALVGIFLSGCFEQAYMILLRKENEYAQEQNQLLAEVAHLRESLKDRESSMVEERESYCKELAKANSDPKRNAFRHQIERLIDRFLDFKLRACNGERIFKGDIFSLENEANRYLQQYMQEYKDFLADYSIPDSCGNGEVFEDPEASRRLQARIDRLKEALSF